MELDNLIICMIFLTGETLIPLYQGKVIDMVKGEELQSSFYFSIGQLVLVCLGR